MKVMAINGSPRKNWNTDTLLKQVLEGAASAGAETEMVYLYDLKFRGCVSCLACKLQKDPRPNRCVLRDDLTAVLDRVHEADAVILGSPIYFSEITGEARSFLERFLFQYLNYDDYAKPLSPRKRIGLVFTMNCPESIFGEIGYDRLFSRYEEWMKHYFGHCETLLATDTLQAKDYKRYHLGRFDAAAKQQRHETVFPEDCRKAFELGRKLAAGEGNNADISIREISDPGELKQIGELAWRIFPKTYEELIPAEQIPYMMRMMYDEAVLRREFAEGMKFALIMKGPSPIGYISWHLQDCPEGRMVRLEKLYLDFSCHGRSIGHMGLRYVIDAAVRAGASFITLNVNKGNLRAQKAYCRAGFYRWRSEKEDVGNGFFKDDYVMRYDITANRK